MHFTIFFHFFQKCNACHLCDRHCTSLQEYNVEQNWYLSYPGGTYNVVKKDHQISNNLKDGNRGYFRVTRTYSISTSSNPGMRAEGDTRRLIYHLHKLNQPCKNMQADLRVFEARKSTFEYKFLIWSFRKLRWTYTVYKWKVLFGALQL